MWLFGRRCAFAGNRRSVDWQLVHPVNIRVDLHRLSVHDMINNRQLALRLIINTAIATLDPYLPSALLRRQRGPSAEWRFPDIKDRSTSGCFKRAAMRTAVVSLQVNVKAKIAAGPRKT